MTDLGHFTALLGEGSESLPPVCGPVSGGDSTGSYLQRKWFSGNIGLHHIHHVLPRIPNYKLQQCYDECPPMQDVPVLTLHSSIKSLWLNLWDEKKQRLVSFQEAKRDAG